MNTEAARTPLAIVGLGCLFPRAAGPGFYWANLRNGVDCVADVPPTHWDPADYFDPDPKKPDMTYARRGAFLSPVAFDPMEFSIAPRDIEATDTTQLLGLVAAKQALTDAGVVFAGAGRTGDVSRRVGAPDNPATHAPRSPKAVDRTRVSVILGVTGTLELVIPLGARLGHPKWKRAMKEAGVPDDLADDAAARIAESYVPWQENSFPGLLGNVVAGRIANKLDLGGTNCVVDAACASSLSAVHLAALELQTGKADVVVTGGADTFNDIFMFMCFSKTPALSPTGNAKPFDAAGDGTILGEGLGVVVLKRLADAERDGDTIYAVIKGIGSSSDGKGNAIYAPSAAGQKMCLLNAYAAAGVSPDTVELVEAHGTGTKVGDTVEITALSEVYSATSAKPRPWCAIGSVKSQIGHTKAAAGAASLVKAALALYYKVLPPTLKVTEPVEPLRAADSPFYVNTEMRPWLPRPEHPRRAALSAFGFGGSNFHAVLEEYRPTKAGADWDGTVEVVALSADTPERLAAELEKVEALINPSPGPSPKKGGERSPEPQSPPSFSGKGAGGLGSEDPSPPPPPRGEGLQAPSLTPPSFSGKGAGGLGSSSWDDFARFAEASRAAFRSDAPCRLCFAAHRDATDLPKLLAAAMDKLRSDPASTSWHTRAGAHFGRGPATGKLGVLFPGQGSQYPGMLRGLACTFPEVLESLAAANAAVPAADGQRLSDRVYPPTTFDPETKKAHERDLRDTRTAQPGIGAVGFGAWALLADRFGLAADAFAGHSYGELVALAAAGRLKPADLFALSRVRGELMARQRDGDPGSMLAVLAPLPRIEAVLRESKLNLVVANKNAPQQTVLSGATAEVERVAATFAAAGVTTARLPVAAAFHSEFVADAAGPFRAALDGVEWSAGGLPVFANTTAAAYPADAAAAKDLLANQLAKPVAFVDEVRAMAAAGVRTFVEVGPGSVLTKLADAILAEDAGARAEAFALDASGGRCSGVLDLGNALARLAARGHAVRLTAWEQGSRCRPPAPAKPGLTVALSGANYVAPRAKRPPRPASVIGSHKAFAAPTPVKSPSMSDAATLAQALLTTQQTVVALQRMQEQAAQLHRQFLESQEAAQRTLQALVEQQQALLRGRLGAAVALPPMPAPPAVTLPPVVVPAPAPVPQPAPAAATAPAADHVSQALLAVVAEKTGYPVESLSLGLSLDADLGVDSIKRVEILAALQEKLPGAPPVKPEHLGTLLTLQDVADFLAGPTAATPTAVPKPAAPPVEEDVTRTMPISREQLLLLTMDQPSSPKLLSLSRGDIAQALLAVVAEKTGYPVESLSLGLSLDADLGVDSIKRVEILAALQEKLPGAPPVKPEHLGTLLTLQDVADFLAGAKTLTAPATTKLPHVPPVEAITPTTHAEPAAPPETEQVSAVRPVQASDSMLRPPAPTPEPAGKPARPAPPAGPVTLRQPVPSVTSDRIDRSILQVVDLDPGTPRPRVPLSSGEIWVVGEADPLTEQVAEQLAHAGFNARVMGWSGPGTNRPTGALAGLVLIAPPNPDPDSGLNHLAFQWLQQVGPKLRQTGRTGAAVFVTVARLDGTFGLTTLAPDTDPTSGGLAGLVKTARFEWPEVTGKAIDLDPAFADAPAAAAAIVEEILTGGPVEVGVAAAHRCALELARTVRRPNTQLINIGNKDVILVTGGARGVTAEAAVALAETYGCTLVLTGRTPTPTAEPEWLAGLTTEADIKKALSEKLGPDGGPRQVGEQYQKVAAQREIRATLKRIAEAGAKGVYFPVNVADGRAVADLLHQVRVKHGPITGIVHGAGVLADRRIEDLTIDQFDQVYSTKVEGLRNLLDLLAHEDLKALVLFSSTTARLGRVGQIAYAAANEVLNKTAQVEARRRPGCRVVAFNWGPWEGGMVTPGLRRVFEAEGVGLIPLADGAFFLVQELNAAGKAVEVVALAKSRLGGSGSHPGIITTPPPAAALSGRHPQPAGLVSPPNAPVADLSPAFERSVEVATHPILKSHVIDGRAVLPMALHLEWLAHAALHGHPGLVFHGFNDLRVTQGVTVEAAAAVPLRALAGKATRQDRLFVVPVELRGRRKDGREVLHSRAEIVLAAALPKPPPADRPPTVAPAPFTVEQAYADVLFHGPDLRAVERIEGVSEDAFIGTSLSAPPPADWLQYPLRSGWVADPLVLDASFQMMILWTRAVHGQGSLPCSAGRYRQFRRHFPTDGCRVVIRVRRDDGKFARADIDYLDADGRVVAQMQDYECLMEASLAQSFRRNQLGAVKA